MLFLNKLLTKKMKNIHLKKTKNKKKTQALSKKYFLTY